MKISFSATNPCHVYEWALALHQMGKLGHYYSGYPRWKLKCPIDFPLKTASWRTLVTYTLYRFPESIRPSHSTLFQWQDFGFDRAIAKQLETCDFIHGMPSQCAETFAVARQKGVRTVLNHATGPVKQQLALVEPEYRRVGVDYQPDAIYNEHYLAQEQVAFSLADYHCVASSVVKQQLINDGFDAEKIFVIPYGVDADLFPKSTEVVDGPFNVCFAGMMTIRKGIHYLLKALEAVGQSDWTLNCYGLPNSETEPDFQAYRGSAALKRHGTISRSELGQAFHKNHVLVLPSAEEAFGLVVAQALQAGTPCIVSDRVGSKDLIQHRVNGSIVPFGDADALAEELTYWEQNRIRTPNVYPWKDTAQRLVEVSEAILS